MTFTWRRGAAYLLIRYERTVREALRNPIQVLSSLTEKSKNESYRFQRLYRNLYNPEFYWLAYKNIYANTGSMTAGADGTTIDGMSDERIQRIIESMRDKSYLPKPARREYIAKKNSNKKRPLGIQSGNDKLVQEVVKMILESIYEPVFKKTSHGFRPNKSCQTALYQIQKTFTGTNWFVEGDIHACFDSFNHHTIIRLLRKRIDDEMFLQLIWKFLKAGYMEQWTYNRTYSGVPQGSGVSPVLANVYLHYTLDTWFDYVKKHEFKGEMYMVRYADDFVCLFQYENEAQKFYQLLIERLKKFGLEIAEDKSRILPFGRYKGTKESFDFLGFTHYNAKSHWGKYCVLHRTSKKKLKMKREAIKKWLWEHMHESIKDTIEALNVRLTGHYRYYGIYGNFVGLLKFYKYVLVELRKSKRRRDQTNWLTWIKYINILKIHPLECPKIYLNSAY